MRWHASTGSGIQVARFGDTIPLQPRHDPAHFTLVYLENGTSGHRVNRQVLELLAGDVLVLAPGATHALERTNSAAGWGLAFDPLMAGLALGKTPTDTEPGISRIWWSNPLLSPFVKAEQSATPAVRVRLPASAMRLWTERLRIMDGELADRQDGHEEMAAAYLHILLIALSRVTADHTQGLTNTGEPRLANVFKVIEQRYPEHLSTSDIAAAVGLTPEHLTTMVRRRTGRTVGEWITERRMAAARDLLRATDLSVQQIASRVGIPEPAYFNRRFRRHHGMPPGAWRTRSRP